MCIAQILLKATKNRERMHVDCSRCYECRAKRANAWAFRLQQEERRSTSALFLTITYDTEFIPITKTGQLTVQKTDVQLWIKKLRKLQAKFTDEKIKYFCASEYGTITERPHYHMIIFNLKDEYYAEKTWQKGNIHYGTVTPASIAYTTKYMQKPKRIDTSNPYETRQPEFQLSSMHLGSSYLSESIREYHEADILNRFHLTIENNKKLAMPRYYKQKLYTDEQRQHIGNHIAAIQAHHDRQSLILNPNYLQQLHAHHEAEIRKFNNNHKKCKL